MQTPTLRLSINTFAMGCSFCLHEVGLQYEVVHSSTFDAAVGRIRVSPVVAALEAECGGL